MFHEYSDNYRIDPTLDQRLAKSLAIKFSASMDRIAALILNLDPETLQILESNDCEYFYNKVEGFNFILKKPPIQGLGPWEIDFSHSFQNNDHYPSVLGIDSPHNLVIRTHLHQKSYSRVEELIDKNKNFLLAGIRIGGIWTSFYFDSSGNLAKVSSLPTEIPVDEPVLLQVGPCKHILTPMTPSDFEIVGFSLNHLEQLLIDPPDYRDRWNWDQYLS